MYVCSNIFYVTQCCMSPNFVCHTLLATCNTMLYFTHCVDCHIEVYVNQCCKFNTAVCYTALHDKIIEEVCRSKAEHKQKESTAIERIVTRSAYNIPRCLVRMKFRSQEPITCVPLTSFTNEDSGNFILLKSDRWLIQYRFIDIY